MSEKLIEVLNLFLKNDWAGLLNYLTTDEIREHNIAESLEDYTWFGEYETDARYTYPNREKLINVVIKKALLEYQKEEPESFLRKFSKEIERGGK